MGLLYLFALAEIGFQEFDFFPGKVDPQKSIKSHYVIPRGFPLPWGAGVGVAFEKRKSARNKSLPGNGVNHKWFHVVR